MSLIGRPVTARIERAAPPRASPSTRVSTTPVMSTASWNALAIVTASWPVSVGDGQTLLTADEIAWLDAYHARVRAEIGPQLEGEERAWLEAAADAREAGFDELARGRAARAEQRRSLCQRQCRERRHAVCIDTISAHG